MQNMINKSIGIFLFSVLLISCAKYDSIDPVDGFSVKVSSENVKVNEPVVFSFNTGPDMLIFYSGEPGKNYQNAGRTGMIAGINKLVFQTSMQQGVLPGNDSLRLLISTNLKNYDSASVVSANWVDITSRNTKWPTALGTSFTTSDSVDISTFNTADSVCLAFRYMGKSNPLAAQRRWQIQGLTLSNRLSDGTVIPLFAPAFTGTTVTSTFANTGWVQLSLKGNGVPGFNAWNVGEPGKSATNSVNNNNGIAIRTAYPIQFDPGTTVNNIENDDWLITAKTSLKTTLPDAGVVIKNETNASIPGMTYLFGKIPGVYAQYQYAFTVPGTYKVTIVAQNVNNSNSISVIRQFDITVRP